MGIYVSFTLPTGVHQLLPNLNVPSEILLEIPEIKICDWILENRPN